MTQTGTWPGPSTRGFSSPLQRHWRVAAGLETLEQAFPFARRAEIRYKRPARGAVRGSARVEPDEIHRVLDELERNGRSELTVRAQLAGDDGEIVAEVDIDYAFRPHPGI